MKKILCIVAATALLLAFAACGAVSDARDTLDGMPKELLAQVRELAQADLAMNIGSDITAERAQHSLGLTEAQFTEYVDSAYEERPVLASLAQSNAIVKCKDAAAAAEVKKLVAGGFDSGKWKSSVPEQAIVIDSGSYIMLSIGTTDATDAFVRAFKSVSGGYTGELDVFFRGE